MPVDPRSETATLLDAWERAGAHSGAGAGARLVSIVYRELKQLAHSQLEHEHVERTLQTTALVHEAWLRLADDTKVTQKGRAYFFAAAAQAMRRVLVDRARLRGAAKRIDPRVIVTVSDEVDAEAGLDAFALELIDLDGAIAELAALNPRHARVVECRFFGGMSVLETAEALDVSERTVKSDWALARAWLYRRLGGASLGQRRT